MRTSGLRSKLVTDSLGWTYRGVEKGSACVDSRIVGFDVESERLFGVRLVVVVGMVSSSSSGHSVDGF